MAWSKFDIGCCCGEGATVCEGDDPYSDDFTGSVVDPGWMSPSGITLDQTTTSGRLRATHTGGLGEDYVVAVQCISGIDWVTHYCRIQCEMSDWSNQGLFQGIVFGGVAVDGSILNVFAGNQTFYFLQQKFTIFDEHIYKINGMVAAGTVPDDVTKGNLLKMEFGHDGANLWMEVFINGVSKATASLASGVTADNYPSDNWGHGVAGIHSSSVWQEYDNYLFETVAY